MKFPKRIRHKGRGPVLVTIYRRPDSTHRLYWRTRMDGKPVSRMKDFQTYAGKEERDAAHGGFSGHDPNNVSRLKQRQVVREHV